jgi:hypothetical protein
MSLILHCNASPVTLTDLAKVKAKAPEGASEIYQPVNHIDLVNLIKKGCKARELEITSQQWGLTSDRLGLFGEVKLKGKALPKMKEMECSLGVRHANNRKMSVKFATGANVFVCDNMAILGDFILSRRHTNGIELDEMVTEGIENYIEQSLELPKMKPELEKVKITPDLEHKILTIASHGEEDEADDNPSRMRLIRKAHLWAFHNEWMQPTHKDFQPRNGWSLYNCYTEVMKRYNPHVQLKGARMFRELILENSN